MGTLNEHGNGAHGEQLKSTQDNNAEKRTSRWPQPVETTARKIKAHTTCFQDTAHESCPRLTTPTSSHQCTHQPQHRERRPQYIPWQRSLLGLSRPGVDQVHSLRRHARSRPPIAGAREFQSGGAGAPERRDDEEAQPETAPGDSRHHAASCAHGQLTLMSAPRLGPLQGRHGLVCRDTESPC